MTAPMNPADVPHELIEAFERAALMSILHEDVRPSRYILAAVIPAIRAQVADDLRHQLQAEHDRVRDLEGATLSEERKIARHQGALAEAIRMLARIARGDQ